MGSFYAGQTHVETLGLDAEPPVIDSEEVEHGGMQVADVDDIVDRVVTHLVGGPVRDASFDSAAGHPHGKALDVVIAAP